MQCIFDPKMAKTTKTRIFLDTTLPFDDSKRLSQVSDQVLDKSDARISRYGVTDDGRTDARTHERESIGLNG